jgi:RNA-directed DNA polymerase
MKSILIPAALALAFAAFRELNVRHRRELSMVDIARQINPLLRIECYGRYALSALSPLLRYVNQTPRACVMRKFKRAF